MGCGGGEFEDSERSRGCGTWCVVECWSRRVQIFAGAGVGGAGTPGRAEARRLKGGARSVNIIHKGNVATVKDGRESGERLSEARERAHPPFLTVSPMPLLLCLL